MNNKSMTYFQLQAILNDDIAHVAHLMKIEDADQFEREAEAFFKEFNIEWSEHDLDYQNHVIADALDTMAQYGNHFINHEGEPMEIVGVSTQEQVRALIGQCVNENWNEKKKG